MIIDQQLLNKDHHLIIAGDLNIMAQQYWQNRNLFIDKNVKCTNSKGGNLDFIISHNESHVTIKVLKEFGRSDHSLLLAEIPNLNNQKKHELARLQLNKARLHRSTINLIKNG